MKSTFSYTVIQNRSITGAAVNIASLAKTVYAFMTRSLISNHKDVAHILPVATIDAKCLHDFLQMLVIELEHTGFKVIAVISDSPPILQIV